MWAPLVAEWQKRKLNMWECANNRFKYPKQAAAERLKGVVLNGADKFATADVRESTLFDSVLIGKTVNENVSDY